MMTSEQVDHPYHCRLCRRALNEQDVIQIGPFPKAAQYYPQPDEFEQESGVVLNIVECAGCGLTQLTNDPVDYYQQVITAASLSPSIQKHRLALFSELRKHYPEQSKPKAIEIGCSYGDTLPLLRETGFESIGIECNPDTPVGEMNDKGVLNQYLLDMAAEHDGQYDLLVSFNYLEHQPDTRAFLEKCYSLLSDEGQLLLTVPNLDFLLASRSGHEFVVDHLVYFTENSLETAFRLTGFSIIDKQIINNQYDIQIIAEKRPPSQILACKNELTELVRQLNERLEVFSAQGKKVAVWGAGHRTLALLSLSEYSLINCIIDSAKFKHYQYSPLSHLQILPPDILLEEDCDIDIILVMVPGIYPQEVIKHIQSLPRHYDAEQFPAESTT